MRLPVRLVARSGCALSFLFLSIGVLAQSFHRCEVISDNRISPDRLFLIYPVACRATRSLISIGKRRARRAWPLRALKSLQVLKHGEGHKGGRNPFRMPSTQTGSIRAVFKQTTSPAVGRFREGKGLSGFRNPMCRIAGWSRDRTSWPNCRGSKTLITHTTIRGEASMKHEPHVRQP